MEEITQLNAIIKELNKNIAEFVKNQPDLETIYLPIEGFEIPNLDTEILTLVSDIKNIQTVDIPALEIALEQSEKDIKTYKDNIEQNEIIENETAKEKKN